MFDKQLKRYIDSVFPQLANTFREGNLAIGTNMTKNEYRNMGAFQQNLILAMEHPTNPAVIPALEKGYNIYVNMVRLYRSQNRLNADNLLAFHGVETVFPAIIQRIREIQQQSTQSNIPVSYAASGWEEIAKDMWQKEQGNFVLLVQKFGKEFFSTVKDVKHMRIYSNNIPFNTLTEAMNASVTSMAKLVHSQPQTERHEYKPKYIGGQGRLF